MVMWNASDKLVPSQKPPDWKDYGLSPASPTYHTTIHRTFKLFAKPLLGSLLGQGPFAMINGKVSPHL